MKTARDIILVLLAILLALLFALAGVMAGRAFADDGPRWTDRELVNVQVDAFAGTAQCWGYMRDCESFAHHALFTAAGYGRGVYEDEVALMLVVFTRTDFVIAETLIEEEIDDTTWLHRYRIIETETQGYWLLEVTFGSGDFGAEFGANLYEITLTEATAIMDAAPRSKGE